MMKAQISGLKRRQTYEDMIDYLHYGQEVVKYPDRRAKQLRESPYMTQLDAQDLDEQHQRILDQQKRQSTMQEVAAQTGRSQAEQNIQRPAQEIARIPRAPPHASPPNLYEHFDDAEEGGPPDDPTMRQETGTGKKREGCTRTVERPCRRSNGSFKRVVHARRSKSSTSSR